MKSSVFCFLLFSTTLTYSQTITLDWVNQMQGGESHRGVQTTVSPSNIIYAVGQFDGSIRIDPPSNVVQLTEYSSSSSDFFVAAYDTDGHYLGYSFSFYGTEEVTIAGIVADAAGNVYLGGTFTGGLHLGTSGFGTPSTETDGFVARFDATGDLTWYRHITSTAPNAVTGVMLTSDDDLVVSGYFGGDVPFGQNAISAQGKDGFICRYNGTNNNTLQWMVHQTDQGNANDITMARLTSTDEVLVAGNFASSSVDFDPGPSTFSLDPNNGQVFVAKYSTQGNLQWAKNIDLSDSQSIEDIAFDDAGNIYLCGEHKAGDDLDPSIGSSTLPNIGGNGFSDCFFATYNSSFDYQFGKTVGSNQGQGSGERALQIGVASCGAILLYGYTTGNEAHLDPDNLNTVTYMNGHRFIAAYDPFGGYLSHDTIGFGMDNWFRVGDTIYSNADFSYMTDFDLGISTTLLDPGNATDQYIGKYVVGGCGLVTNIVEQHSQESEILIYPNPSNGTFTIQALGNDKPLRYEVVDQLGRVIISGKILSNTEIINLEGACQGVFVLNVWYKNEGVNVKRVVVTKD